MVNSDRCSGTCTTLDDPSAIIFNLSDKLRVPNETKYINLKVINMVTGINELKSLVKHISCKYKCRFDVKKCNST